MSRNSPKPFFTEKLKSYRISTQPYIDFCEGGRFGRVEKHHFTQIDIEIGKYSQFHQRPPVHDVAV
jgi:hypothetical protein